MTICRIKMCKNFEKNNFKARDSYFFYYIKFELLCMITCQQGIFSYKIQIIKWFLRFFDDIIIWLDKFWKSWYIFLSWLLKELFSLLRPGEHCITLWPTWRTWLSGWLESKGVEQEPVFFQSIFTMFHFVKYSKSLNS